MSVLLKEDLLQVDKVKIKKESLLYPQTRFLVVQPQLACRFGVKQALVVQFVYEMTQGKDRRELNGKVWIKRTMGDFLSHMPFVNELQMSRYLRSLEKSGVLESCQPEGCCRVKYYRVDVEKLVSTCNGA